MVKALSGALTLLLIIVVLRLALPEISVLVIQIVVKVLNLFNSGLDSVASQNL